MRATRPYRPHRTRVAVALVAVLGLAFAVGCQQTGGGTTGTTSFRIDIVEAEDGNYRYDPGQISINSNRITRVTWHNLTEVDHKVRLVFLNGRDAVVRTSETPTIPPGGSTDVDFDSTASGNLRGGVVRVAMREARGSSGGHFERGDIDVR